MLFKEIISDLRRPWTGGEQFTQENAAELADFLGEFANSDAETAAQSVAQDIADGRMPVVVNEVHHYDADEALDELYGVLMELAAD